MNPLIKKELDKISSLIDIGNYDEETIEIFVPKQTTILLKENNYYLIELGDTIINPSSNSLLASNWNNGIVPKHRYYKVDVCKVMGKMIKVNGIAYNDTTNEDMNDTFCGWLPIDEISIKAQI